MKRFGVVAMLSLLCALGAIALAPGQWDRGGTSRSDGTPDSGAVDGKSNGQPAKVVVDDAAVAKLEEADKIFKEDGREREAIEIALSALPTFEQGQDYDHLVDCVFLLGEAYYYIGDWANALKFMQRAADLGYRYFPDEMSSYPLKVIGESQFELGDNEAALATFQERVQKLRKANDTLELPGALFDVGGVLINLGREKEALPVLSEALDANNKRAAELAKPDSSASEEERAANVVDHAEIIYHMAIANFHLQQFDPAKQQLEEAYSFFNSIQQGGKTDVKDRLVSVLDDLVLVSEKLGNTKDAEKYRRLRDGFNK
jgi:tetratricopeptide (TPR) repeat protein